jgi:PMC2NT (NUC016) domain
MIKSDTERASVRLRWVEICFSRQDRFSNFESKFIFSPSALYKHSTGTLAAKWPFTILVALTGRLKAISRTRRMDLTTDFKPFQDRVTSSLLDVTRTAGQISAEDLSFHRSSNASLSRSLDAQNSRLLQLTQKLLKAATGAGSNISPPRIQEVEEVDDNWRGLVDVVDDLLERADACLDEYTGVIKRLSPAAQDGAMTPTPKDGRFKAFPSIFSVRQLAKPQLLFEKSRSNDEKAPFKPLLRTKPHGTVGLDESIGDGATDGLGQLKSFQPTVTDAAQIQPPLRRRDRKVVIP